MKRFTSTLFTVLLLAVTQLSAQTIFTDAYASGVSFVAFDGSVNALTVDNTTFQSGTSSLKIVVPAAGYTGGALVAATAQNLSTYNAVSFWIKGSAAKTLNVAGLGNSSTGTTPVYQAELANIPVTTTWTKIIIPIPDASKLTAEKGLFHFAEGSDEGAYTIWLDNIQYENLTGGVIGAATATMATETISKGIGDSFTPSGMTCTFPVNTVATKLNLATGAYFTFTSSNATVATMSALGVGTALAVGSTNITAKLGTVTAAGTLTVNVAAVTAPTAAAPTPTRPAASVISLYSKPYTNVAGIDWFPNWGQSTVVSDVVIAGDSTKKYTTMNYQGVQFASDVNVTTMNYLHLDLWTPNITSFKVFLINTAPATVEQAVTLTPTLSGWNSFNIPLASYNTVSMAKIGQFKFESVPFGSGTAYIDNIYFFKTGVGTKDLTFSTDLFTATPSVSSEYVSINLTEKVQGSTRIMLTNLMGQNVYDQTINTKGSTQTQTISTKALPAGMYIVGVRVGSTFQSQKITVSH